MESIADLPSFTQNLIPVRLNLSIILTIEMPFQYYIKNPHIIIDLDKIAQKLFAD